MKQKLFASAAALLLTVSLAACAGKENTTDTTGDTIATDTGATTATTETAVSGTTSGGVQTDAASQQFVMDAGMAGKAEVMMGELGQQKAQSADVKAFAEKMVTEHTASNQELQQIVTPKGLTPPAELDGAHKAALDHLQTLSGAEFDKAFMSHMVDDHQKAVDLFTNAQNGVQDPEIKAYVTKTLPVLQQHLQAAKDTQSKVK